MNLKDVFNNVKTGNIREINNEFARIKKQCDDMIIGTEMIKNDLSHNSALWDDLEENTMILFQRIKRSSTLKQEIIHHLGLTFEVSKQPVLPYSSNAPAAKELLIKKALSFYKKAYDSAVVGGFIEFRDQALDYRILSGLENKKLSVLVQQFKEISYYIELEEFNVKKLWLIYQKGSRQDVEELLYKSLKNHIFYNNTAYVDAYLKCASSVNSDMKRLLIRNYKEYL